MMMYIIKVIVNIVNTYLTLVPVHMDSTWIIVLTYRALIEHFNYELDKPGQISSLREGIEDDFRFLVLGVWIGDAS